MFQDYWAVNIGVAQLGVSAIQSMPNAHVIGLGKSGAAALLKRTGWEWGWAIAITSNPPPAATARREGITVHLGASLGHPDLPQLVVVSPGVPWDSATLVAARSHGIETMEKWNWQPQSCPCLATWHEWQNNYHRFSCRDFSNSWIKRPCLRQYWLCLRFSFRIWITLKLKLLSWVIAEISSYQIESSPQLLPIGIWTTYTGSPHSS